ncbi:MAG TPA: hypothetical protein VNK91_14850 [Burkholderiaceae bacterium]|nr:hypothetical protein [Burkholderiaceae bacterium]
MRPGVHSFLPLTASAVLVAIATSSYARDGLRGALDPVVRGDATTATARGDHVLEMLVEKMTGKRSAVWVDATALQELGGDGCKRVRLTIRAPGIVDAQGRTFHTSAEMNVCRDGPLLPSR